MPPVMMYTRAMTKRQKRPQTPKPIMTRSLETRAMLLRNGDGYHTPKSKYTRKVKHKSNTDW